MLSQKKSKDRRRKKTVARIKIKNATDQRKFTMVYNDFIECPFLTTNEKMIFIALKKFSEKNSQCYPSIKKISRITQLSERTVRNTIKSLEQKHIIRIESRSRPDGGTTSKLYTLYDTKEVWNAKSDEEIISAVNEVEDIKLISELQSRGYKVTKEEEPVGEPSKAHTQALQKNHNQFDLPYSTTDHKESQVVERYSMNQIQQLLQFTA